METSFNKICKSIASIRTESQCESIEAMIKTFKDKYKREGHEYSYILVGALLMAKQIKFNQMKHKLSHTLFEVKKIQKELFEVYTTWFWDNGTYTTKDISHHATRQEAEEQRLINSQKYKLK